MQNRRHMCCCVSRAHRAAKMTLTPLGFHQRGGGASSATIDIVHTCGSTDALMVVSPSKMQSPWPVTEKTTVWESLILDCD